MAVEIRSFAERNWRYLFFFVVTFVVLAVLYTWRMTLLPFMLGLVMAYLFWPVVRFIERLLPPRGRWAGGKRVFVIFFILITVLGVLAFAAFIFFTTLIHTSGEMIGNASRIIGDIIERGQQWTQTIRDQFPEGMRNQVDAVVDSIGADLADVLTGSFTGGKPIVSQLLGSLGIIFGFVIVPIFLFYILKDEEKIWRNIYAELPPNAGKHTRNIVYIVECVFGQYLRGQLILGSVVGGISLVSLLIIGVPFAAPLAVFNGFCEMIPTIGPIIGGTVMALVTLALAPDKVIWVVLLAVVIQLVENNLLVPKIMSSCLRLHPSLILALMVTGGVLWGLWGLILVVPLTSTLVDIFTYVRKVTREANAPTATKPPPSS
jgi:predicted PurR-regulated permease PerM